MELFSVRVVWFTIIYRIWTNHRAVHVGPRHPCCRTPLWRMQDEENEVWRRTEVLGLRLHLLFIDY